MYMDTVYALRALTSCGVSAHVLVLLTVCDGCLLSVLIFGTRTGLSERDWIVVLSTVWGWKFEYSGIHNH